MRVEFETELVSALLRWLTAADGAGVPPRRGSKKFRVSAYARKGFAGLVYEGSRSHCPMVRVQGEEIIAGDHTFRSKLAGNRIN